MVQIISPGDKLFSFAIPVLEQLIRSEVCQLLTYCFLSTSGIKVSDELFESQIKPNEPTSILSVSNSLNGKSVAVAVADLCEGKLLIGEIDDCNGGYSNLLLAIQHIFPAEILYDNSVEKKLLSVLKQHVSSRCTERVMIRRRAELSRETVESFTRHFVFRIQHMEFRQTIGSRPKKHIMNATALLVKYIDDAGELVHNCLNHNRKKLPCMITYRSTPWH